jgi:hypothetical protein
MAQASDDAVIFAEATLISADERLDLPSVQACDSKSSLKGPVIIATIPIHDDGAIPAGAAAADGTSPPPHQNNATSMQRSRRRPVWIGAGLLIVVMLAVMVVFSVHARPSASALPPQPQVTSQDPAMESSANGVIPQDDYNWKELDDKQIDDLMEADDWKNRTETDEDTDDWYDDDEGDDKK